MTAPVVVPDAPLSLRRRVDRVLDTPTKRTGAISFGVFFMVSLVRWVTGADAMTAGFTFGLGLAATAPILCAAMGGLVSERSGTVNIGLEGMMTLGTWFAAYAGWQWGIWWAIPAGMFGGMLGGLLHGMATVHFGVNHIVSGIAINLIAPGVTRFLSAEFFVGQDDGSISSSPTMDGKIGSFTAPFISGGPFLWWEQTPDPLGWLDRQRWLLISDAAGLAKGLTTRVAWSTIVVLFMLFVVWYLLWRMPLGLRMRSAGEKPDATDSLGVSVYLMRYLGCAMSGALAGLGGAWLAIDVRAYQEGQVGGRGFLGLAALVFGNWMPLGILAGSSLFGYVQALSSLPTTDSVRALFLLGAIAAGLAAVAQILRKKPISGSALAVTSIALLTFYLNTERVNNQLVFVMPYLVTLVVISAASQQLRPPAAEGITWRKGGA